jgi:hypothetical protein
LKYLFVHVVAALFVTNAYAADYVPDDQVPAEVRPFVEPDRRVLALAQADLNGDDRGDYALILAEAGTDDNGTDHGSRSLLILVRLADATLKLAKRNDRLVYCANCGGVWGDPFADLSAARKSVTISHYGGSNWRWTNSVTFSYSRIDQSWQLVRVEETSFHTGDPERVKKKVYKPPRHFGKIDIADFDPENYLNERGRREARK